MVYCFIRLNQTSRSTTRSHCTKQTNQWWTLEQMKMQWRNRWSVQTKRGAVTCGIGEGLSLIPYSYENRGQSIKANFVVTNPTGIKLQRRLIVKYGFWNTTETTKRYNQTQQQQTIRLHWRLTQRGKTILEGSTANQVSSAIINEREFAATIVR